MMSDPIKAALINRFWLFCLRGWLMTRGTIWIHLATKAAPHVTHFPDRWYTQRVSYLRRFGMTQAQILAVWEINGTWDGRWPKAKPGDTVPIRENGDEANHVPMGD